MFEPQPEMHEPKVVRTSQNGGAWHHEGTILFSISPGADVDLSAKLEIEFDRAASPFEAKRQALNKLLAIANAFQKLAERELKRIGQ